MADLERAAHLAEALELAITGAIQRGVIVDGSFGETLEDMAAHLSEALAAGNSPAADLSSTSMEAPLRSGRCEGAVTRS